MSRANNIKMDNSFKGEEKEELIIFSREVMKAQNIDYFIFGHRHLLLDLPIESSRFITLGDWVSMFSYAVFDGEQLSIETFKNE